MIISNRISNKNSLYRNIRSTPLTNGTDYMII